MPKFPLVNEQYRNVIGNHTRILDDKYGNQHHQNERIKALARNPGLHSGNHNRQRVTHALAGLLSVLNIISNSTTRTEREIDTAQPLQFRSSVSTSHGTPSAVTTTNLHEAVSPTVIDLVPYASKAPQHSNSAKIRKKVIVTKEFGIDRCNKRIASFLEREGVLNPKEVTSPVPKELLISGVAHWLYNLDIEGDIIPLHRRARLARCILRASENHSNIKKGELSHQQIDNVIATWMFDMVLGGGLNDYLTKKIETGGHTASFTIGDLYRSLTLETLIDNKDLNINEIPFEWKHNLGDMWSSLLKKALPIIFFDNENIKKMEVGNDDFSYLHTGSLFLDDFFKLSDFSYEDVFYVGSAMWSIALNEGIGGGELSYFLLPAMLFSANNVLSGINTEKINENNASQFVNNYIAYKKHVAEEQRKLADKINNFHLAADQWLGKGPLADKIINDCITHGTEPNNLRVPQQAWSDAKKTGEKQNYLNGLGRPCKTAPEDLTQEYQRLTAKLSDAYKEIDKYYISTALESLSNDDKEFISSSEARIYPVSFKMSTTKTSIIYHGFLKDMDIYVNLNQTDLFSVISGGEERIYALKMSLTDDMMKYDLLQVGRDIKNYIHSGILDYNDFGQYTTIDSNRIRAKEGIFKFYMLTKFNEPYPQGDNKDVLIERLSSSHRDEFYQNIYTNGDELSRLQKVWKITQKFIPFMDCVSGIKNNDPVQALPSCMLDPVAFISVVGQALKVSSRFSLGLANGVFKGNQALRHGGRFAAKQVFLNEMVIPKTSEFRLLGKHTLEALDPGLKLTFGIGKKLSTKLVDILKKEMRTTSLAEKIASSDAFQRLIAPDQPVFSAQSLNSGVEDAVQKVRFRTEKNTHDMGGSPDVAEASRKHDQMEPISEHNLKNYGVLSKIESVSLDTLAKGGEPIHLDHKLLKAPKERSDILYHIPRNRRRMLQPGINPPAVREGALANVEVPRLAAFLPLNPVFNILNKINIDFSFFQSFVIRKSFPHNYNNIMRNENDFSSIHMQRLSDSEVLIPEVFSHLKNNFGFYKARIENAKLTVNNLMLELNGLFHGLPSINEDSIHRMNVVTDYLKKVLGTDSADVINNARNRLNQVLERTSAYFNDYLENVYLVTAKRDDSPFLPSPDLYGFTRVDDSEKRIFIFADCFDIEHYHDEDMVLTVVHEATHAELGTQDFFYTPYTNRVGEPEDIPEAFIEQLNNIDIDAELNLDNTFLNNYVTHMGIERPDIETYKRIIINDDMLKANIIMENADSLSNMIIDLHELLLSTPRIRHERSLPSQSNIFDHHSTKMLIAMFAARSGALSC